MKFIIWYAVYWTFEIISSYMLRRMFDWNWVKYKNYVGNAAPMIGFIIQWAIFFYLWFSFVR